MSRIKKKNLNLYIALLFLHQLGAIVKKLQKSDLSGNVSIIEIENAVKRLLPKILFMVQGESSTGIYQSIEGIGEITRR